MCRAYDKYGPNLFKTETNRHYWGFFERTATPYYHLLAMKVHRLNYIELTLTAREFDITTEGDFIGKQMTTTIKQQITTS